MLRSGTENKEKRRVVLKSGAVPTLSEDGRSVLLEPASPLQAGTFFELQIRSGPKGVRSERGIGMAGPRIGVEFSTTPEAIEALGAAD